MKNIKLLRYQLDQRLAYLRKHSSRLPRYTGQWIKLVREALGMQQAQLARRLNITPQALNTLEKSELGDTITVSSLKKVAQQLECQIYIGFIPNDSLDAIISKRARTVAEKEVMSVNQSMSLEKQGTSPRYIKKQIAELTDELIRNSDKRIWEDL